MLAGERPRVCVGEGEGGGWLRKDGPCSLIPYACVLQSDTLGAASSMHIARTLRGFCLLTHMWRGGEIGGSKVRSKVGNAS